MKLLAHLRKLSILLLLTCSSHAEASGQELPKVSYDGYESVLYSVTLNFAGEISGEFVLDFDVFQGPRFERFLFSKRIRPNSYCLGRFVTVDKRVISGWKDPHVIACLGKEEIPLYLSKNMKAEYGVFGMAGTGLSITTNFVGDTLVIGGAKATVRFLSPTEARIYFPEKKVEVTLPLSATGALRMELNQLRRDLWDQQEDELQQRRDEISSLSINALALGGFSIYALEFIVVLVFMFAGLLFCNDDEFLARLRNPKRFLRQQSQPQSRPRLAKPSDDIRHSGTTPSSR